MADAAAAGGDIPAPRRPSAKRSPRAGGTGSPRSRRTGSSKKARRAAKKAAKEEAAAAAAAAEAAEEVGSDDSGPVVARVVVKERRKLTDAEKEALALKKRAAEERRAAAKARKRLMSLMPHDNKERFFGPRQPHRARIPNVIEDLPGPGEFTPSMTILSTKGVPEKTHRFAGDRRFRDGGESYRTAPGPGTHTHALVPSVGEQRLSRRRNAPKATFGTATRYDPVAGTTAAIIRSTLVRTTEDDDYNAGEGIDALGGLTMTAGLTRTFETGVNFRPMPGPGDYSPRIDLGAKGRVDAPAYHMAHRYKRPPPPDVPGPGTYSNWTSAVSTKAHTLSQMSNAPQFSFGTDTRNKEDDEVNMQINNKRLVPHMAVPGPGQYEASTSFILDGEDNPGLPLDRVSSKHRAVAHTFAVAERDQDCQMHAHARQAGPPGM